MSSKFKLNYKGVGDLMKSKAMQSILTEHATKIRNRCGEGYEQDIHVGRNRANAMVRPASAKALKDNLENNTLLKAVHR